VPDTPSRQISDAVFEEASKTGRLNLSRCNLTSIPSQVYSIPQLRELDLSDNRLRVIPIDLCNLSTLQLLKLDNNWIEDLPAAIGDLPHLHELHIDDNLITRVPRAIDRLRDLRILTINSNKIDRLPDEIGQLSALESLMANNNKLTNLPPSIGGLSNLRRLWLDGNQLLNLPPEIGQLEVLEKLNLKNNLLDKLPPELGKLPRLTILVLGGNLLTYVIRELCALPRLEVLDLRGNLLANLPPEIGMLSNLRELLLDENHLNILPSELAPLLRRGLTLTFSLNPVAEPLAEIADRGADALAAYLTSLGDARPQYEAKVLLVGEGNVGKTSLVAALHDEEFVADRSTTHGIEIRRLTLHHPNRTLYMTLRTWDFGGQEIYRITHQFFFSKRALYLLVWSAREGQEQDEVEGWLSRIRLRVAGEASTIIVATHCSERNAEIDVPRLNRLYPGLIADVKEIDNRTELGIAELRKSIAEEASKLPQMGQLISPRWIATRDELSARAVNEPQISFEAFRTICHTHGVADREVRTLAELLHDLGQVIYYGDDEGLRDVIVLDPEWLTRAISYVLEDKVTRDASGVLDYRRLSEIWVDRPDGAAYHPRYHPYFLRLMEKFDVSYRLSDPYQGSLVAQLVPHARPTDLPWDARSRVRTGQRGLALVCRLSEPAPGLIAWLTVRHHRSSIGRHWRGGVFLRYPIHTYSSEALLELRKPDTLYVEVRAPSPDLFFNVIRDSIEHLIMTRWPGIKYQLYVPCPTIDDIEGTSCTEMFSLNGLVRFRENGGLKHTCLECLSEHDVSKLLTGFEIPRGLPLTELQELQRQVEEVAGGVRRIEGIAADTAESVRRLLRMAGTEVLDCPRLFSVVEVGKAGIRRVKSVYQHSYRVVLWCEHTAHWHPWTPASYDVAEPKEWLVRVRPYAKAVYSALRVVVPVASAISELTFPSDKNKAAEVNLSVMGSLLESLPAIERDSEPDSVPDIGRLAPAEGQALRAFRMFLFEHDQARSFGDLRRVQGPSGEVLWVCPLHHPEYDPGLPDIPRP